jgi:ATP-binding cassette, subfamily C, bacteriocin exporter
MMLRKGEMTGLAGESGSGKTTVINLLQKLYPLRKGKICTGPVSLDQIETESLRKMYGVVPQQVELFTGSILENITPGDDEPDMRRIMKLCEEIGIAEAISRLPNGFQTVPGVHGTALSGGQRQCIAIARALYRDPEVVIFDEATSSLDSESERYIKEAVRMLKKRGKTIIVIAHRLSTIMEADTIYLMQDGRIVESGTHSSLIRNKNAYYNLWNRQFRP